MSYHTKMLTHYYALHFIWQGKPPTSFSVSQGNLTSRLFFHMQTPSFGSGPPPFAHRRPSRAPRPRRVGATSYTDPPDAVPDPPRRRRPPWAPSSQQPGATGSTDPPDVAPDHTRRQWPPWAPSSSAARGHQQHRPAGRSTGSTPPAVATLGAKLVGGPGPPAVPTRRTSHRITPAGSGHPGRRARRRPGATSYTGRGERHRSLGSQIGMYTDKNRHHSPWVHWNLPTRAHQNNCHPPWNEVLASWHRRAAPLF